MVCNYTTHNIIACCNYACMQTTIAYKSAEVHYASFSLYICLSLLLNHLAHPLGYIRIFIHGVLARMRWHVRIWPLWSGSSTRRCQLLRRWTCRASLHSSAGHVYVWHWQLCGIRQSTLSLNIMALWKATLHHDTILYERYCVHINYVQTSKNKWSQHTGSLLSMVHKCANTFLWVVYTNYIYACWWVVYECTLYVSYDFWKMTKHENMQQGTRTRARNTPTTTPAMMPICSVVKVVPAQENIQR